MWKAQRSCKEQADVQGKGCKATVSAVVSVAVNDCTASSTTCLLNNWR